MGTVLQLLSGTYVYVGRYKPQGYLALFGAYKFVPFENRLLILKRFQAMIAQW